MMFLSRRRVHKPMSKKINKSRNIKIRGKDALLAGGILGITFYVVIDVINKKLVPWDLGEFQNTIDSFLSNLKLISIAAIIIGLIIELVAIYQVKRDPRKLLKYPQNVKIFLELGLFIRDPREDMYVIVPAVKKTANGFMIEAIGNLEQKLLDSNKSLTNYLAQKGANITIIDSYSQGGWVYFITAKLTLGRSNYEL